MSPSSGYVLVLAFMSQDASDLLEPFANAWGEELSVHQYNPHIPEPCSSGQFERFDAPFADGEELKRLLDLAKIAVRATGLNDCACRVRHISTPWRDVEAFGIEHGSCMSFTDQVVAVDKSGAIRLLSGDRYLSIGGTFDSTAPETSLSNFNELAKQGNDVIVTAGQAEDYMETFLSLYKPQSSSYIPTREIASIIARLPFQGDEADRLERAFQQVQYPVVHAFEDATGFSGEAFVWSSGYGTVEHIELRVTRDGLISVTEGTYARQPE